MTTISRNPWIPESVKRQINPKQAIFLAYEGMEALYGGAAGGGKSYALLMAALQYADYPNYHALILRRTFAQLAKPGALLDVAEEWLAGTRAKPDRALHKWTFPKGGTLSSGHMENEHDKFNYQSAAYNFVGYDELTQFTAPMYTYLFSRTRRRAGGTIPNRMRAACTPGAAGHEWVKKRFISHA